MITTYIIGVIAGLFVGFFAGTSASAWAVYRAEIERDEQWDTAHRIGAHR